MCGLTILGAERRLKIENSTASGRGSQPGNEAESGK